MKVRQALSEASARLTDISETPRLDAELLMAHALEIERDILLLSGLDRDVPEIFDHLITRRMKHEPVAYILGWRDFWTIRLKVGSGALIPRPDSETLIEAAIGYFGNRLPATILDLGTGPGTLLLAALDHWPQALGLGVDQSEDALGYARDNARALGFANRCDLQSGNWGAGIDRQFDLIFCNPPYIESMARLSADIHNYEPKSALYAGADGLDDYRRLAPQIMPLLKSNGLACIEIGSSQAEAVSRLFTAAGLRVSVRKDLGGRDRCLLLTC